VHLADLHLDRYRNIRRADLSFGEAPLHVIVGENGQGKTNLLSAIYWLATLTPLQTHKPRELVMWEEHETQVRGEALFRGLRHSLAVSYSTAQGGARVSLRGGKRVPPTQYFGALTVVSFTPSDLELVRGAPDERRRFLDRAIFNERHAHLHAVQNFSAALDGRNRLLRDGAMDSLLAAYEGTLAELGARLMLSRAQYMHELAPLFSATLHEICGFSGSVAYKPALQTSELLTTRVEVLQEQLAQYWAQSRATDRQRGFTQRGPQLDDLSLRLSEHSAKSYASQGQQRAIALALKIAQIEHLSERLGERPVLLLDDVSSELDARRAEQLFSFLDRFSGQVFLTTTHERHIPRHQDARLWRLEAGTVSEG
jgi:DNA replication and repair protein RecF